MRAQGLHWLQGKIQGDVDGMEKLARVWKRSGGLGLTLSWTFLFLLEMGTGLAQEAATDALACMAWVLAITSCALIFLRVRTFITGPQVYGIVASIMGAFAPVLLWLGVAGPLTTHAQVMGVCAGVAASVSLGLQTMIWGQRLSGHEVFHLESDVPRAFLLAFIFCLGAAWLHGIVYALACALLPAVSMHMAFQMRQHWQCPYENECIFGPRRTLSANAVLAQLRSMGPLLLLFMLMWAQFATFHVMQAAGMLSTQQPAAIFSLLAFACALLIFYACVQLSRYLNYSLMYRQAIPLVVMGYAMLFTCRECAPGNNCGPLLACILNMTAAFGVLICLWTVTPKHICRMGINPIVAFCAFAAAGGIGAGTGLAVLNSLGLEGPHAATICFVITTLLVGIAMVVGYNPAWFFVGHTVNPLAKTKSRNAEAAGRKDEDARKAGEDTGAQISRDKAATTATGDSEERLPLADMTPTTPLGTRAQIEDACLQRAAVIQKRYGLTEREAQIAALLLEGRSRPYIRDELVISLNTVHTHARSIYSKCGVHSQREFMELPDEK